MKTDESYINELLEEFRNIAGLPVTYCPGTLAEFHTNQTRPSATCDSCTKRPACEQKHENGMDRIKRFYAECFAKKPRYGWSTPEPAKCSNCFVAKDCQQATEISTTEETHCTLPVISATTPIRATPSLLEIPAESEAHQYLTPEELAPALAGFKSMSNDEVTACLRATSQEIRRDGKTEYSRTLRVQFMAASIELNSRGIMPAFSPACRAAQPKEGSSYTAADAMLSNDLRIIDIDYLAKHHPHGHGDIFDGLLDSDGTLNFERTWKFVSHRGRANIKAELLQITPAQQAELFIIRDALTRKNWDWVMKLRRAHLVKINSAIKAGHGRKKGDPEHFWQLYCLCVMHEWNLSAVLNSALRLPHTSMPCQLRKTIDWLKQKSRLPGPTDVKAKAT